MLVVVYKLFSVAFLCGAIMAENTSAQGKNKCAFKGMVLVVFKSESPLLSRRGEKE